MCKITQIVPWEGFITIIIIIIHKIRYWKIIPLFLFKVKPLGGLKNQNMKSISTQKHGCPLPYDSFHRSQRLTCLPRLAALHNPFVRQSGTRDTRKSFCKANNNKKKIVYIQKPFIILQESVLVVFQNNISVVRSCSLEDVGMFFVLRYVFLCGVHFLAWRPAFEGFRA